MLSDILHADSAMQEEALALIREALFIEGKAADCPGQPSDQDCPSVGEKAPTPFLPFCLPIHTLSPLKVGPVSTLRHVPLNPPPPPCVSGLRPPHMVLA